MSKHETNSNVPIFKYFNVSRVYCFEHCYLDFDIVSNLDIGFRILKIVNELQER